MFLIFGICCLCLKSVSLVILFWKYSIYARYRYLSINPHSKWWILSSRPCLTGIVEEYSSFWSKKKWPCLSYWHILTSRRHHFLTIWMFSKDRISFWMKGEDNLFSIRLIIPFLRKVWIWYLICSCKYYYRW